MFIAITRLPNGELQCVHGTEDAVFAQARTHGELQYGPVESPPECAPLGARWFDELPGDLQLKLLFLARGMVLAGWHNSELKGDLLEYGESLRTLLRTTKVYVDRKKQITVEEMLEAFRIFGREARHSQQPKLHAPATEVETKKTTKKRTA